MKNSLIVGLSSWIIQDGNYRDFKRGDQASFALEFNAPTALDVVEDAQTPSLEHLHGSIYRVLGKVALRIQVSDHDLRTHTARPE
jgi:hypothetical protein